MLSSNRRFLFSLKRLPIYRDEVCQCLRLTRSHWRIAFFKQGLMHFTLGETDGELYITRVIFITEGKGITGMVIDRWQGHRSLPDSRPLAANMSTEVIFQADQRGVLVNAKYQGGSICVQSITMYSLLLFTLSLQDAFPERSVQYFMSSHKNKQKVNKDNNKEPCLAPH